MRRTAAAPSGAAGGGRRACGAAPQGVSATPSKIAAVELYTIREAAQLCGMTYEALRARVDRGSLRAGKRREDAARMIPRSELQRTGLLPGADVAELQSEVDRLQTELRTHRLLAEKAQSATAAEHQAREQVEHAFHQERAEKQTVELQLREIERAHVEASTTLEQVAHAGWRERRRLLRELRASSAT